MKSAPNDPNPLVIPEISVPDIRDYELINTQTKQLLDSGHQRIRLVGVHLQRLILWGLSGSWNAEILVEGSPGPEFAADLNAPNLIIHCSGSTADAAGRSLKAGRIVIAGNVGDAVGYHQQGGSILVRGDAKHRAGLMQNGGTLLILGSVGRLAGERQSGGALYLAGPLSGKPLGPHVGHGRSGGELRICS